MRGFFKKYRERQGPKGKNVFLLPFPSLGNRGAARGCRRWPSPAAWASGAAGRRGKREREAQGGRFPPRFWGRRPAGRKSMAAGGSRRRRPWWLSGGARRRPRRGGRVKGRRGGPNAPLTLGRGSARRRPRGGRRARRLWRWWRHWELGEEARDGGGGCGDGGTRRGGLFKGGVRWWGGDCVGGGPASFAAGLNGVGAGSAVVERRERQGRRRVRGGGDLLLLCLSPRGSSSKAAVL